MSSTVLFTRVYKGEEPTEADVEKFLKESKYSPLQVDPSTQMSWNEWVEHEFKNNPHYWDYDDPEQRKRIWEDPLRAYELMQELQYYEQTLKKDEMMISKHDRTRLRLLRKLANLKSKKEILPGLT